MLLWTIFAFAEEKHACQQDYWHCWDPIEEAKLAWQQAPGKDQEVEGLMSPISQE
jgi:hypothetical protein